MKHKYNLCDKMCQVQISIRMRGMSLRIVYLINVIYSLDEVP